MHLYVGLVNRMVLGIGMSPSVFCNDRRFGFLGIRTISVTVTVSPSSSLTFTLHSHDHSLKNFFLCSILSVRSVVSTYCLCVATVIIDMLLLLHVGNHASASASFVAVATCMA